jgi:hypothetical protein
MLVVVVEVLKLFLVVLPEQVVPVVGAMVAVLGLEALALLIAVGVVVVDLTEVHRAILLAAQAVQASSSSNTPHLLNPYSHSKVLAIGLPLLA